MSGICGTREDGHKAFSLDLRSRANVGRCPTLVNIRLSALLHCLSQLRRLALFWRGGLCKAFSLVEVL